MTYRYTLGSVISVMLVIFALAMPNVRAQSLSDAKGGEQSQSELVDELVSRASESGANIIVINPSSSLEKTTDDDSAQSLTDDSKREMSPLMKVQDSVVGFRNLLKGILTRLPDSYDAAMASIRAKSPTGELWSFWRVLGWSSLLLMAAAVIEYFFYTKLFVSRHLASRVKSDPLGYSDKLPLLIQRAVLRIIGIALSMLLAYIVGVITFKEVITEPVRFTIAVVYITYAVPRIIAVMWRVILVPYLCQYRIPQFKNATALKLYHWLWIGVTVSVLSNMFSIWVNEIGQNREIDAALTVATGLVVAVFNTAIVLANRTAISRALRGGIPLSAASGLALFVSHLWAPLTIGYFLFSWLEISYRLVIGSAVATPLLTGAYGVLMLIIVVYGLINYAIERFFRHERANATINTFKESTANDRTANFESKPIPAVVTAEDTTAFTGMDEPDPLVKSHALTSFEDLTRRVAGILSLIAGFWALTRIYNLDDAPFFSDYITRSLDLIFILFIGYIVYQGVRIWIDNKIEEEGGTITEVAPGDEGGVSGTSRISTLLPLFRNFMLVVVAISVLFSALIELGINVSPLFAGAGVIGLAIGFGSQALVRDIFSGAFFLFDDAFRRGEYVDIGEVKGTVEKISVRSFQLRHHLGPLHTIPFGEIRHLTNYSRDWVMMKLPLRLTYDTDLEQVRRLIKKLGERLMEDPEIGDKFLQPLKSQGVIEMQDSAMIVRVKFMTQPGDQWTIRKRVFQEIRDLFLREGIKFAHREVTVRLADNESSTLSLEQKRAIAGATLDVDVDLNDGVGTKKLE